MSFLSLSFSPADITEMVQFAGMQALLSSEVQSALDEGASVLIQTAQQNMHWMHPTGALSASMQRLSESPYEILIGSQLPYAARREFGFHGADSLGRVYNDPGAFFLTRANEDKAQEVLGKIEEAVQRVLARSGGGY